MKEQSTMKKHSMPIMGGLLIVTGLYLGSLYNYLLFHGIIELFSVVVAGSVFQATINTLPATTTLNSSIIP